MSQNTYRASGVDLDLLDDLKQRIRGFAALTHGPEVLSDRGNFAGLYRLTEYQHPILVASVDGVGTKLRIAAHLGHYESVGQDLVTLNVNDILTRGAKPLFFLDYIAFSSLDEQRMETLLRGIVWGCREVGCALIGGETAQMPGSARIMVADSGLPPLHREENFELAGFVVGVVERDELLDGIGIQTGDCLVGIPSSGVHTNGFSLVRRVFHIDENPAVLFRHYDELQHQLGEELLMRHRCYYPLLKPALGLVKALSHITGGGLPRKMTAFLPPNVAANFRLGSWTVPPIFSIIQREGSVSVEEMYNVFNMGLGMVAVCAESNIAPIRACVPDAVVVGHIIPREGEEQVLFRGG